MSTTPRSQKKLLRRPKPMPPQGAHRVMRPPVPIEDDQSFQMVAGVGLLREVKSKRLTCPDPGPSAPHCRGAGGFT